jgi:hypothetical protein
MNKFEKLIELIVNEDNKQAQKLFHEIVVEKSRTIYESLLEDEDGDDVEEMEDEVDADEEGVKEGLESIISVEEAKQLLDHLDGTLNESDAGDLLQRVAEHFDVTVEGLVPVLESHGDALLEMAYGENDEGEEEFGGGDMEDEEIEDRVVDLEDAIDELKAEFDAMIGDEGMDDEFGGEEDFVDVEMDDVEAGKNDMGGTTANIAKGGADETGGKADSPKDVDSRANNWKNTGGKGTKNSKTEKATKPTNKTDSEKSILDKQQG